MSTRDEGVTYTVKELLAMLERTLTEQMGQINLKLDGIVTRLDGKADNARMEKVERRLDAVEGRIGQNELKLAGTAAVTTFQRLVLIPVFLGVLGSIATLVWLASGGH
jgi:hypothetical protein